MVSVDIDALGRYFGSRRHVLAYLFGSHARGQAGPLSDVDTAIFLDNSVAFDRYFDERLEMTGGVMDVLGVDEVDVAILNQTQSPSTIESSAMGSSCSAATVTPGSTGRR